MSNQISEDFYQQIINFTIKDEEFIYFKNIINSNIPKSIKNFFRLKTEELFSKENIINIKSERFDLGNYEIKKVLDRFENSIKDFCKYSKEEYLIFLSEAFQLHTSFLLKPSNTLVNFIFSNEPKKTIDQINHSFEYFSEYLYYKEILTTYLEQQEQVFISKYEFEKLLNKVNKSILKRLTPAEISLLAKPIFDFYSFYSPIIHVPSEFLLFFYSDKALNGVATAIKLEADIKGNNKLSLEELRIIIESLSDLYSVNGNIQNNIEPIKENEIEVKENELIEYEKNDEIGVNEVIESDNENNNNISNNKITTNDLNIEKETTSETSTILLNDVVEEIEKDEYFVPINKIENIRSIDNQNCNQNFNLVFPTGIRLNISEDEMNKFVKKIFNKDKINYSLFIEKIKTLKNWKESYELIDSFFTENNINPFSKYAVEFTNKIQEAFKKEE